MTTREDLLRLIHKKIEVESLCGQALTRGAPFEVWPEEVAAKKLLLIYARRERRVRQIGQESVGFTRAVEELQKYPDTSLKIGYVDDRANGGFYFQLFVSPDETDLVACLGVRENKAPSQGEERI